ncbi:MAG: hypothetical protein JO032_03975 [Alphaproteobacteria bacterium]|nr:hypothetical protein [Alphaproteobacteria bacterium]MBV9551935.1 hypothetical protein [Alphaproteobacteria bacterium]
MRFVGAEGTQPAMARTLGTIFAVVLILVMAYPFARDAYHRYQVARRLDPLMSDSDRAAFRVWSGDAASFGRSLYERCELTNGVNAPACEPYRRAIE